MLYYPDFFFFILSIAHFFARLSNDENCTLFLGGPNSPYLQALCLNMLKALWGSMYVTYISWFFFLYSLGMAIFFQQMAAPDFFCIFFTEIFLGNQISIGVKFFIKEQWHKNANSERISTHFGNNLNKLTNTQNKTK